MQRAIVFIGKTAHIKDTQTNQSVQAIPMSADLEQILAASKQESGYLQVNSAHLDANLDVTRENPAENPALETKSE